ncbi:MAG: ATP-binding protein [Candidatus Thiodiazotropha endolucinida]
MKSKLCLLTCGHFQAELEQVLREEDFTDVELVLFPANCDRPLQNAGVLEEATQQIGGTSYVVLGGSCISAVKESLPQKKYQVVPDGECFELFVPSMETQPHADAGAHIFTPGMLRRWRESYESWGFSKKEAREFFAESTSRLVLLDTGVDSESTAIEEVARELNLPCEKLPVGLEHLRLQLHRLVAHWRAEIVQESEHQLADYAMVHDLAGDIAALTDEESVIDRVMELFTMFCAPTHTFYLPIQDGEAGELRVSAQADDAVQEGERLYSMTQQYQMDEERGGFRINFLRGGQRLGALAVWGIAFDQYRPRYLSLALNIMPVVALAISNARTYRHRLEAEAKITQLNRGLEERLTTVDALNQELEAFTYSVSHDLRGPLRSLDGFSSILLREYSGQLDEKGQRYLDRLRANAQRMGQLIDDLLRLSRLTRANLAHTTVDLSEMVQELAQDLKHTSPERKAEFRIRGGLIADCDPSLLKIVLENLIGNAWKYSGRVSEAIIEFGSEEQDGEQVYFVRDNGDGFDMAYADKLFSPFQRLHSDAEFPGTGIGLATAQRIILRHGGRIWAVAKPGEGASFYFTL